MDEDTSQRRRLLRLLLPKWRPNWRDLGIALFGALSFSIVDNVGKVFDVWEKTQIAFGWKADSLDIARADEKERFTRELLQLAYRRVHAIRDYTDLAIAGRGAPELDEAWRAYQAARGEWNQRLVVNVLGVEKWYGTAKSRVLEDDIEALFEQTYWCMNDLRFFGNKDLDDVASSCKRSTASGGAPTDTSAILLRSLTNQLLRRLYCFAAGIQAELPASLTYGGTRNVNVKARTEKCA